ncbi:MAG: FAD-dependent oxidoreductase [Deltaproteobacteria bacterium]
MNSRIVGSSQIGNWDTETDVLVMGFGCAGAAAAIEAARAGADVVIAERASGAGGTSAMSGGVIYLGGGTSLQTACGFEDTPEEMFKYLEASCGEAADQDKLRLYCDGSVEHFQWFVDLGVPFKPVFYPGYSGEPPNEDGLIFSGSEEAHPYNTIARPAPRGHVAETPHQTGWLLMEKLAAGAEAAGCRVLTDTRCTSLVVDRDGGVVGATARCAGQTTSIHARRGVVLATGGFITNKEMLSLYAPMLRQCRFRVGAEGDDGSGINMGTAAGGVAINMEMGSISIPLTPPKDILKGILVNGQGQRFINEDVYFGVLGAQILFRQYGRAYMVMDEATFVRPEVEREIAGVGQSAEELEGELGLPPGSLASTLDLYNRHAEKGEDPLFHKAGQYVTPLKPPYGALDCTTANSMFAAFTLGGLRTSANGEVLTIDGEPLKGLFAAGRATAGLSAPGYSSGLSIGDGTFFGRRAGRAVAGL